MSINSFAPAAPRVFKSRKIVTNGVTLIHNHSRLVFSRQLVSSALRTGYRCTYFCASATGVASAALTACSSAVILPTLTSV